MLADILARCEADDAVQLLEAAHAKVERDGEHTRKAVMSDLMVKLQSDVLHDDYGYPPGHAGVAKFGAEMQKSIRGFPDDREFHDLINELAAIGKPRGPLPPGSAQGGCNWARERASEGAPSR